MERIKSLSKEVCGLIQVIEEQYPQLYSHLDKHPVTILSSNHFSLSTENFANYLDSLKQLLEHSIDNRQKETDG